MAYNRFSVFIIIRIILILINLIGIVYLHNRGDLIYTIIFLCVLVLFQTIDLVRFVNKTNNELAKFILALRDTDYTAKFPKADNESFGLLYERFQSTLDLYKKKETKYEAQYLFIQELIDNIETGLMSFDENRKVTLINKVARKMRSDYKFENNQGLVSILGDIDDSQIIEGRNDEGQKVELLVNKSVFKLLDKPQTIFTFKDISSSLESKEIESWQKLIRILAHEIINSLTPITSLSETTLLILNKTKQSGLEDIELSLKTIKDRSEGLLNFMEDYRKLVKIPEPKLETFKIKETIAGILHLFQNQLEETKVTESYESSEIVADPILLEQILVNLLTNSIQSMQDSKIKSLTITYSTDRTWMRLGLKDTGCGMDKETLAKSMIPFFTTKNSGSGIGLSLVQQILNLHRGRIEIDSKPGEYTQIVLLFPVSYKF
ncbi:MAG: ATP-binding protein [Reichenbachiella sp.]|uniref:sensor histidine kinase n=1 Tax=Reichenbachiella sp. TaxID=2184521 RepID=UPI002965DCEB|nr:ATP-binding protein [Reichenbachiella sp.]MDW3210574.1 ATP-binding protein [Reichenbachiella sp.]